MMIQPKVIILRHRKENLKKCSLRGLEQRSDLLFFTYPQSIPANLNGCFILDMDGEPLTVQDNQQPLILVDGTWRYAAQMQRDLLSRFSLIPRALPPHFRTAYPRRQEDCLDPNRGLASLEALYIAMQILEGDVTHLLDHYYWKEEFLKINFIASQS